MSTAVARRADVEEIVQTIDKPDFQRQLSEVLPANVSLDKFTRTTKLAVQMSPEILEADRKSLFMAMVRCAASGLLPDGRESALVVVKEKGQPKVQWWPMIGGLRKKAAEHGITLAASVVCANDEFSYSTMPPAVSHRPAPLGVERGEVLGAFAVALDGSGRVICPPVVMSTADIEQVRATSRAATSEYGPWVRWWGRMACKTVARRLFMEMPLADRAREDFLERLADVDADRVELATASVPELAALPVVDVDVPLVGEVVEDLGAEPGPAGSGVAGEEVDDPESAPEQSAFEQLLPESVKKARGK